MVLVSGAISNPDENIGVRATFISAQTAELSSTSVRSRCPGARRPLPPSTTPPPPVPLAPPETDEARPKLVEALHGHRKHRSACVSLTSRAGGLRRLALVSAYQNGQAADKR